MSLKRIARTVITLKEKVRITPHFIRGIFTGDDLAQFAQTSLGDNNKIFIPPAGVKKVHFPAADPVTGSPILPPADLRPEIRTYTHRFLDLQHKTLYIDFVDHGDNGPASKWIGNARPGDQIGLAMRLDPVELFNEQAADYILVGDATAIPVLTVILGRLPASANVRCIIEVHSREDEQRLSTGANATFTWLHNPHPENGSALASTLRQMSLPARNRFAYVAAELETVRSIRDFLRRENNWKKEELYAYSYWKAGVAESASAADRRAEKGNG